MLPEVATVDADGANLTIVHDGGPAKRPHPPAQEALPEGDAVVFGHSHIPLHETADDGFQIFNPGSPTRPAPAAEAHHGSRAREPRERSASS